MPPAKFTNILNTLFPEKWQDHFIDAKGNLQHSTELIAKFNSLTNSIFVEFQLSLLQGEYIYNKSYQQELMEFQNSLEFLYLDSDTTEEYVDFNEEFLEFNKDIYDQVVLPMRLIIIKIKWLIADIDNKLKGIRKTYYFSDDEIDNKIGAKLEIDNSKKLEILHYNIELCYFDRNLSVTQEDYERLITIVTKLKQDFKTDLFQKVLIDKTNFLLRKLDFRFRDDEYSSFEINFQENDIPDEIPYFSDWISIINEHYENIGRNSSRFRNRIKDLFNEHLSKEFEDFHKLVKHYKDDETSDNKINKYRRISKLIEEFKEKHGKLALHNSTSFLKRFNKNAYLISLNYLYNNLLSIGTEENVIVDEEVFNILTRIEDLQHQTEIRNYFPYQKICEFLCHKLSKEFAKTSKDFSNIDDLLKKLEKYLLNLENNYTWCRSRNFLAFQLPFKECTIAYQFTKETEIDLFIYSAFTLPINYNHENVKIEQLREEYKKYSLLSEVHNNIKAEKDIIGKNKQSIENAERKNIEILSIFSAVVLFTMGEIQIFSQVPKEDLIPFTLMFAYCLVLFAIVIWLITRDYSTSNKFYLPTAHVIIICLLTASTLFMMFMLF